MINYVGLNRYHSLSFHHFPPQKLVVTNDGYHPFQSCYPTSQHRQSTLMRKQSATSTATATITAYPSFSVAIKSKEKVLNIKVTKITLHVESSMNTH